MKSQLYQGREAACQYNCNYINKRSEKYMRKHKVESRLLCYEPLFNASRIKENKTVPPWVRKCHTMQHPMRSYIDRWHLSLSSFPSCYELQQVSGFFLPPFFMLFGRFSANLGSFRVVFVCRVSSFLSCRKYFLWFIRNEEETSSFTL